MPSHLKGKHKPRPAYVLTMDDEAWNRASLSERALHVARSQERLDVREIPKGSNWGKVVQMYLKVAGLFSPAPWCAAFVTWCLIESGADRKKLPKNPASTYFWWAWAKERGRLADGPRRGDLFVWNGKSGGHIGFCLNDAGKFRTLEGNTNDDGSREGYEVAELTRRTSDLQRHPRWGFILITDSLYEVG